MINVRTLNKNSRLTIDQFAVTHISSARTVKTETIISVYSHLICSKAQSELSVQSTNEKHLIKQIKMIYLERLATFG